MTIDERLDRLIGIVQSLAASVVEQQGMEELRRSHAETERLLQVYLTRLPSQ
jgi:hypothetical protein